MQFAKNKKTPIRFPVSPVRKGYARGGCQMKAFFGLTQKLTNRLISSSRSNYFHAEIAVFLKMDEYTTIRFL